MTLTTKEQPHNTMARIQRLADPGIYDPGRSDDPWMAWLLADMETADRHFYAERRKVQPVTRITASQAGKCAAAIGYSLLDPLGNAIPDDDPNSNLPSIGARRLGTAWHEHIERYAYRYNNPTDGITPIADRLRGGPDWMADNGPVTFEHRFEITTDRAMPIQVDPQPGVIDTDGEPDPDAPVWLTGYIDTLTPDYAVDTKTTHPNDYIGLAKHAMGRNYGRTWPPKMAHILQAAIGAWATGRTGWGLWVVNRAARLNNDQLSALGVPSDHPAVLSVEYQRDMATIWPWMAAEMRRLRHIWDLHSEGMMPPRSIPFQQKGAVVIDPRSGLTATFTKGSDWVPDNDQPATIDPTILGETWMCAWCKYRKVCASDAIQQIAAADGDKSTLAQPVDINDLPSIVNGKLTNTVWTDAPEGQSTLPIGDDGMGTRPNPEAVSPIPDNCPACDDAAHACQCGHIALLLETEAASDQKATS